MSPRSRSRERARFEAQAEVFAALGDQTRLLLVVKLAAGKPQSIAQLTAGSRLTRQAITKHLRVLERAGMVRCARSGRERRFAFNPRPMEELREYLEGVSAQWDEALGRLQAFVEA
ncbi:MAG TPA: ArsR family transcriptional regulator [Terriglobales bacterium]|nr:ArsR family transcriptional regulator [Terriglobales bacterium]